MLEMNGLNYSSLCGYISSANLPDHHIRGIDGLIYHRAMIDLASIS